MKNENRNWRRFTHLFSRDENGATAIEYALVAGAIAVAIATVVPEIGTNVTTQIDGVNDGF